MRRGLKADILPGMSDVLTPRESIAIFVVGDRLGPVEFKRYLAELDRNIEGGAPFVMVIDGSSAALAVEQLPARSWQLSRAMAIGKLHRGVAFVTGRMTHDRVRALYALQPPGVPYAFFSELKEAREWARDTLEGAPRAMSSERKTMPFMTVADSR